MIRRRLLTGNVWERRYGYARAVRAGSFVAVSGTVAADADGKPLAPDAFGQAMAIFAAIDATLRTAGGELADAVRLRVHHAGTDPDTAAGFARALATVFPRGAPALTTIRVVSLVSPEFLLEIEADAVIPEDRDVGREPRRAGDEAVD